MKARALQNGLVLIDDNSADGQGALLFANPVEVIKAEHLSEVTNAIENMEAAQTRGFFLAGFFSYELGYCLEETLVNMLPANRKMPLLWFGAYSNPRRVSRNAVARYFRRRNRRNNYWLGPQNIKLGQSEYEVRFKETHEHIRCGDIYQLNLTFKIKMDFEGCPLALYSDLREAQQVEHGAYIDIGPHQILSLSPELFFAKIDQEIQTRPMKGTAKRGDDYSQDEAIKSTLQNDPKQRAENLMIVDLMRNDLSRICEVSSVKVPKLFEVETYPTMHQMTSLITAKLRSDVGIAKLIKAIYPGGSITGCPKISAMEIIRRFEKEPREAYCGSIGFFSPDGNAKFNIAIRSPIISGNSLEIGVGSAITFDSVAADEYEECLLKTQFLANAQFDCSLIETMKWERGIGFGRLERHLNRMEKSSQKFGMGFDRDEILQSLVEIVGGVDFNVAHLRIILDKASQRIEIRELARGKDLLKCVMSPTIMNSNNPWLYHKTTFRKTYDDDWASCNASGYDEIIYQNQRGELTEGSRSNLFLDTGGDMLLTPPINCGVLPGILREELLEAKCAKEQILTIDDLIRAKQIYLGSSLRGLRKAIFNGN